VRAPLTVTLIYAAAGCVFVEDGDEDPAADVAGDKTSGSFAIGAMAYLLAL
jgi:hypothetical protein